MPVRKSGSLWFMMFLIVLGVAKIIAFYFFAVQPFGIAGDADHYHAYALSQTDVAYNLWSDMLRVMHGVGLYSRVGVSQLLLGLNVLAIPLLTAWATMDRTVSRNIQVRMGWLAACGIALYPALYFYALDVYRDEFMMFVFMAGLVCTKYMLDDQCRVHSRLMWVAPYLGCAWLLYLLRPYLGLAFLLAVPCSYVFSFDRARLLIWCVAYLVLLQLSFSLGWLDDVAIHYRAIFLSSAGSTNLGIVFDSSSGFLIQFVRSWIYQILGLYFVTWLSLLPFFMSTVPFCIMAWYLIHNRRYANRFVNFLVVFFVLYSTVWVLGNDNLGAAVRIRMFNYVVVMVGCGVVMGRQWWERGTEFKGFYEAK